MKATNDNHFIIYLSSFSNAYEACRGSQSAVGNNSCNEKEACKYSQGAIGNYSCNQKEACTKSQGAIDNYSCIGVYACYSVYSKFNTFFLHVF